MIFGALSIMKKRTAFQVKCGSFIENLAWGSFDQHTVGRCWDNRNCSSPHTLNCMPQTRKINVYFSTIKSIINHSVFRGIQSENLRLSSRFWRFSHLGLLPRLSLREPLQLDTELVPTLCSIDNTSLKRRTLYGNDILQKNQPISVDIDWCSFLTCDWTNNLLCSK